MLSTVIFAFSRSSVLDNIKNTCQVDIEKLACDIYDIYDSAVKTAQEMVISNSVQTLITMNDDSEETAENIQNAISEINKILYIQQEISSIALIKNGELVFWTRIPFIDQQSLFECEKWYDIFLQAAGNPEPEQYAVTSPFQCYIPFYIARDENMIGIQVPIYSISDPSNCYGNIIAVLNINNISNVISENADYFDEIAYYFDDLCLYSSSADSDGALITSSEFEQNNQYITVEAQTVLGGKLISVVQESGLFSLSLENVSLLLATVIGITTLIVLALIPLLLRLTKPVKTLKNAMEAIGVGDLTTRVNIKTGDEFEVLGKSLNQMASELEMNLKLAIQRDNEKKELEYEVLVAQINPHFIYNTLNTISYLAKKERYKDVECVTYALIELLKDGIKLSGDKNFSSVREEIGIINNYVYIQNYKYNDIFELSISCPDHLLNCMIPTSIIQPLVENALFHGIVPLEKKGFIKVVIDELFKNDKKYIRISINDNGVGFEENKLNKILSGELNAGSHSRNHVGVQNIIRRLSLLYGNEYSFNIYSQPRHGTEAVCVIPFKEKCNEQEKFSF
ncbi:MAG: histidine kinase [Clostridiales bacterium]|nr:histidine kinase [Clostridiales bacterium]